MYPWGEKVGLDEIGEKVFGDKYENIKKWCVERIEADRYKAVPKGRVANVFVVIEPLTRLIVRQEQEPTDVTVVPSKLGFNVPAMLNPKFQSGAVRRQMLAMLHEWFDKEGANHLEELKKLGFSGDKYTCVMRPFMGRAGEEGKIPEEFEGYCGECPNCLIFGYAVQEGAGYNVKSRVEGDLYVATAAEDKVVVEVTFNAVDDIAKTTYRPEMPETRRTGALYRFRMVEVGTPFVGKLVLRDMTFAELMLTLITLARTTRVGGRTTHFGEIKVHIPAILFSTFECGSGYEIANILLSKYGGGVPSIEDVVNVVVEYVSKFGSRGILVADRDLAEKLRNLTHQEVDEVIFQAWRDVLNYKRSLDMFVGKGGEGKEKKKG